LSLSFVYLFDAPYKSDIQTKVNNKMHIVTDYFTGVGPTIYMQD
jgi:hypothetical protein